VSVCDCRSAIVDVLCISAAEGLDDISLTLQHEKEIREYEQRLKSFQVIDFVR